MLVLFFKLNLFICVLTVAKEDYSEDNDLGDHLAESLRSNANLDLTDDDEYEDLRAEFLAYRSALASLASDGRRSLASTPCWKLNGICINYKLCTGYNYLAEVPGCKDKMKVCCFVWDKYSVRDMRDYDIENVAMPWSTNREFGGKGVVDKIIKPQRRVKRNRTHTTRSRALALVIRSN